MQRLKNEILEQRQRGLEEQNRLQDRVFKDMQRTHKEHVDQIIRQMEREQERMRRDNERVLEAKLRVRTGHFLSKHVLCCVPEKSPSKVKVMVSNSFTGGCFLVCIAGEGCSSTEEFTGASLPHAEAD